eukprot:29862-Pelagococcus_subviridis.AAC.2
MDVLERTPAPEAAAAAALEPALGGRARESTLKLSLEANALVATPLPSRRFAPRAPGGLVALRAVVHRRPPLVRAPPTLPQRLVVRPFLHRRRRLVLIDVLARQILPELAVLLAPHEEVARLAQRHAIRALRAPAGFGALRAAVHLRPPHVLALDVAALPQRLVVRRVRHRRRRLVLIDVLARQLLAALAVLLAPREEVVRLAQRQLIRALRTPAGFDAPRAAVHLRPPHVLALQTLPLRLVVRRFRHRRRQLLAELVGEPLAALPVLRAPLDERLALTSGWHDRRARRGVAARSESDVEKLRRPTGRKHRLTWGRAAGLVP